MIQIIKSKKIKAELALLKNQINPHFLFNTLNNLYSLIKSDLDTAQEYVLKLSNMVRFTIYKGKEEMVTLEEEVSCPIKQSGNTDDSSIFLKGNKKHHQVKLNDILYTEAYGNYVKIHLNDKMILTHQTLSSLEDLLPKNQFIRMHKSFIIAKNKIVLIEGNLIHINKHKIPVGKMYRQNINELLS